MFDIGEFDIGDMPGFDEDGGGGVKGIRIAIDRGGTFTDCVGNSGSGRMEDDIVWFFFVSFAPFLLSLLKSTVPSYLSITTRILAKETQLGY